MLTETQALLPEGWPTSYDLLILDEAESTMTEAARRAAYVERPLWIMARRQTAGRARRGRTWTDTVGNLAATLILPQPGKPLVAAQRSFVASLALHTTLRSFVEPNVIGSEAKRVQLKWPNDVLVDGRKIAGILLEAHGPGPAHLLIGIGVNLAAAPEADTLEKRATIPIALADLCDPPDPLKFLTSLAISFAYEEVWFAQGFERTRRAWLSYAARLGETITARAGNTETVGVFTDVDPDGQLVLTTEDGSVTIPAADVYF